tara:strand:- start:40 stop:195 length:156 start_codon:yes stop_codon:yes gene_type:complete
MKDKIAQLKEQLEQTKTLFFKLQGAIEVLESLEDEKTEEKPKKEVAKDDKK